MKWRDYHWTKHALLRIAEYKLKLNEVFDEFEVAIEMEKDDHELLKQFVRHGGIKGMQRKVLSSNKYQFVITDAAVITVVNKPAHGFKEQDGKSI